MLEVPAMADGWQTAVQPGSSRGEVACRREQQVTILRQAESRVRRAIQQEFQVTGNNVIFFLYHIGD